MILLIDNYDSFTYNLYQYISILNFEVKVYKNDKITVDEIENLNPKAIVVSPGPGSPKDSGISLSVIQKFSGIIPILGVCLGHQAIGEVFGAKVIKAPNVMHGKISLVHHQYDPLFDNIPNPFEVVRYHSLVLSQNLPEDIKSIAKTSDGTIMAISHSKRPFLYGVQFHPESILTKFGMQILKNFFQISLKYENIS